jgi:putative hydrolase of the HAD superfamily
VVVRAILFDGDDTLWETERLYDEARARGRSIVESAGLDGEAWEARERLLDVENVGRMGHAMDRFPTSCVQAYHEVCAAAGGVVDDGVQRAVEAAARQVFEQRAPLVKGAKATLLELRARGYTLGLLTKGDPLVQARRIEQSGLGGLFEVIDIVEEKTPESIISVLGRLGASRSEAITVGNSVRSDVLPSLAAGVTPVWIDAHVWEYERQHDRFPADRVIEGRRLEDLLEISLA